MKQAGFTLIEMMIVVAIIGILSAIAYPNYLNYTLRTGRADGMAKLMEVMQAQERFFSTGQTYTTDLLNPLNLGGLGYGANPVPSNKLRYNITAAACGAGIATCVILTATRNGAQANDLLCGDLTFDSRGTKNMIGGTLTWQECW